MPPPTRTYPRKAACSGLASWLYVGRDYARSLAEVELTYRSWLLPCLAATMIQCAVPGGTAEAMISDDYYAMHEACRFL